MIALLSMVPVAWAQAYEKDPCAAEPGLAAELQAGQVASVSTEGPFLRLTEATSLLPPSSSARPDVALARRLFGDPSDEEVADMAADLVSCTYAAARIVDGDPATAWCEGAEGDGVGQAVLFPIPKGATALEIRNGYAKSAERYAQNARARQVEVVVLGQGWEPPVQGSMAGDLPVLGRHEVELKDVDAWQPLPLPRAEVPAGWSPANPAAGKPEDQKPSFVAIRLLSTWPGSRWQDTCLSEIRGR